MKFRVLGSIEVESAGQVLEIGPRQRRAVLAALVVDAGSPVTVQRLTERVWGDAPPDAARSSLYAHVARLRQTLGQQAPAEEAPVNLGRSGDGYLLSVPRDRVDLHRFVSLLDAARDTSAPASERVVLLREAMELWRGTPFSPLLGEWAAEVRRSMELRFVGAATAWAAAELELGNAELVADRLVQTVEAHPLAEPLVAMLMRALGQVGRTAEALECFAELRARLADQLGTEPGPELRQVHVSILRGESRQPEVVVKVGADPAPPPRQLPVGASRFVGHSAELTALVDWFAAGQRRRTASAVLLYGPAGVGKSALAVQAAHRVAGGYPDGQLYLDLRGSGPDRRPLGPAEALSRLLRSLGVAPVAVPAGIDDAAALFRTMVAGRRLLVLLDNATEAGQVRPLLASGAGCATIVTSCRPLGGLGELRQARIGPLSTTESVELLSWWAGRARVAAEPAAAAEIARWCERTPLALGVAGVRLAARPHWPLAELAHRLGDERRRLDNLAFDGVSIRASLAAFYQPLQRSAEPADRATACTFEQLATSVSAEFGPPEAAQLLRSSRAEAERALENLVDAQLVDTPRPGRYRMSDLLRLYAREQRSRRRRDEARPVIKLAGVMC
ncbi:winged helix-turn-helix domain-containing protein [Natronosporangium hydrolyticum]|uniref:Winged helix-turn-helix domain-containing protein n=1 Tax=Natronosporangium hydrolyticum TaxID=2811111 RepID=A0A895Y686_9ACTN|nr:BTAD domain-containing putative transcriptional regulator [Natronosporangium hydrolyticum]QSB12891.1 winged helix-turn-helix domain-containing protein [Natronosporangium hydrolyticum]